MRRACPKPPAGSALKETRARRHTRLAVDEREHTKVRTRSGGRCEVVELYDRDEVGRATWRPRCVCPATDVHHLISGRGQRWIGLSSLSTHQQHLCAWHHREITGGVGGTALTRIGGPVPRWTDRYERVR